MRINRCPTQALTFVLAFGLTLCGCASRIGPPVPLSPVDQVFAAERAFAQTMARRDLTAFTSFVSEEAVFFSTQTPLHGKQAVAAWWSRFFSGEAAPFSWEPEQVEVLKSGTLALSTGPVKAPDGRVIAQFTSIWRQEAPGIWRVIFDKGGPANPSAPK